MESVHHHHHHHASAPLRAGKKMKKRKELDALVAHSHAAAAAKRNAAACNGAGGQGGQGAGQGGCGVHKRPAGGASSQDQLLSESTDDQDDYWSGKSGGGGGHGGGGHGRAHGHGHGPRAARILLRRRVCGSLLRACTAALVFACVVATVTVMWLFIDIREQVTSLRSKLDQVVAGSQGVTDALQKYHSLSRGLQKNQTVLYAKLEVLETKIANFSSQVTPMQYTLHELQEKLKAAPELVNVPQNLKDLKENVASFGSQIRDFNTTVTELKNQNSQLLEKTNMLVKNITNTEQTVEMLLNASQQNHGTSAAYGEETKAILSLTNQLSQNITRVNETLSNKFQWIDDEQKKDKKDLEELQELGQSISARVTTLEGECPKSSAIITALQQQIDNITHLVTSDEGQLRDLNNRFVLFQSNNSQLREMVNNMHEAISQLSSQLLTSPATPNGEVP